MNYEIRKKQSKNNKLAKTKQIKFGLIKINKCSKNKNDKTKNWFDEPNSNNKKTTNIYYISFNL